MGLGAPFAKDAFPGTRRRRGGRDRSTWRNRRLPARGFNRAQAATQGVNTVEFLNDGTIPMRPRPGRGRGSNTAGSGRGACYDYQAGTCHRGASCRFLHLNS